MLTSIFTSNSGSIEVIRQEIHVSLETTHGPDYASRKDPDDQFIV